MPSLVYACYSEYKGDIRHLFMFYDWNKVDEIENKFNAKERYYNLTSILKAHIFMCKRRIRTYTDLIEEFHENPRLTEVCGFKSNSIPSRTIISRVADVFGIDAFRDVAVDRVQSHKGTKLAMKNMVSSIHASTILPLFSFPDFWG